MENKTSNKECFQFARVADGLQRAGHYALEYTVAPVPPGQVRGRAVCDGWMEGSRKGRRQG